MNFSSEAVKWLSMNKHGQTQENSFKTQSVAQTHSTHKQI